MGNFIKHEFRATARMMIPIYIVAFVSGLASLLFPNHNETTSSISSLATTVFILSIIAIGIMCFVIILSRFYKNVMTDNAYLTMTLPISVHEFIFGELIVSLIWIVLSILLMLAIWAIFLLGNYVSFSDIDVAFHMITNGIDSSSINTFEIIVYIIEGIVILILFFFFYCLRFYFVMSVGQLFTRHRLLACVAIFIALQIIIPTSALRIAVSFGTFSSSSGFSSLTLAAVIVGILTCCAAFYLPTAYILNRKLNIQ